MLKFSFWIFDEKKVWENLNLSLMLSLPKEKSEKQS